MSSINNDVPVKIGQTSTTMATDDPTIAPEYKALKELTQVEYERLLHQAFAEARKTIHESELAAPKTMLALLAVCGVQEVHSLVFKPPSAIRGMALKACAEESRSTKGCLLQAKRELVAAARERAAAVAATETEETEEDGEEA